MARAPMQRENASATVAGREVVRLHAALELVVVRVEADGPREEDRFDLEVLGIGQAAFDRTHRLTRLMIVEPDTLGAEVRIDDVDPVAFGDGVVRALGLAGSAVDAVR